MSAQHHKLHFVHSKPEHTPFLSKDSATILHCVGAFGRHLHLSESERLPKHCWMLEHRHSSKLMPSGASQQSWILCSKDGLHTAEYRVNITSGRSHFITMPDGRIFPFEVASYHRHMYSPAASSQVTVCHSNSPFPRIGGGAASSVSAAADVKMSAAAQEKEEDVMAAASPDPGPVLDAWRVIGPYKQKQQKTASGASAPLVSPCKPFCFVRALKKTEGGGVGGSEVLLQMFYTKAHADTAWVLNAEMAVVECVYAFVQKEYTLCVKAAAPVLDILAFRQKLHEQTLKPHA